MLTSTHQVIATKLGSTREIISRQLKELKPSGHIKLNRGNIKIIDAAALPLISENKIAAM